LDPSRIGGLLTCPPSLSIVLENISHGANSETEQGVWCQLKFWHAVKMLYTMSRQSQCQEWCHDFVITQWTNNKKG